MEKAGELRDQAHDATDDLGPESRERNEKHRHQEHQAADDSGQSFQHGLSKNIDHHKRPAPFHRSRSVGVGTY